MAYYKVVVKFEAMYEVLVKTDDEEKAKAFALRNWGEDDPVCQDESVYSVVELEEKVS